MIRYTWREKRILKMLALGYTNAEIASELDLTQNYLDSGNSPLIRLYKKLGVHNHGQHQRTVAVARALQQRIIE